MGLLDRWRGRTETRGEAVDYGAGWAGLANMSNAGYPASQRLAENLATVTACVNVISTGIASLPAYVYRAVPHGREEAPHHPVSRLIRAPNRYNTWPDLIEWMISQVLLWGNALLAVEYDGAGRPISLTPVPWNSVSVQILRNGRMVYDVVAYEGLYGQSGMPRRYLDGEVIHLKDRSDNGFVGRSRLSRAPDPINNAASLQDWSINTWRNAATPSGAVKVPQKLSQPVFDRLKDLIRDRHQGTANARGVLILENGAEWQSMSVSPEDAEVLASRRFSVEELARLFQVPPPLIQDYTHNTFTNSAQAGLWFAQFSLAPWCKKIEAEFSRSLFNGSEFYLEIDLSGLMRGDYAARWAAYDIAIKNGILDANEIREAEGYNPRAADA